MKEEILKNDLEKSYRLRYIIGYMSLLVVGSLLFGFHMSVYGSTLNLFKIMYEWDEKENTSWTSLLTTLVPVGATISALASSAVMQYGRRTTIFISGSLSVLGAIFIGVVQQIDPVEPGAGLVYFCFGRLLSGLSIGFYSSVTPVFIHEIAPKKLSGTLGCFHQVCLNLMILVNYLIGVTLPSTTDVEPREARAQIGWRLIYLTPIVLVAYQFLMMLHWYRYDSPRFYADKGMDDLLVKSLSQIYSDEEEIKAKVAELTGVSRKHGHTTKDNRFKMYKLALFVGLIVVAAQQITGVSFVIFYAPIIFGKQQGNLPQVLSFLMSLLNFASTTGSLLIVDRLGRRFLLISGSVGISVLLMIMCVSFGGSPGDTMQNWIFNISVFLFIIIYELTHGPVCCVFLSDILFADWMGYCIATGWTLVILVALSTPYMLAAMARWTFFFFGVLMIGIVIVFFFLVKETKGKSKKENLKQYSRNALIKVILSPQ